MNVNGLDLSLNGTGICIGDRKAFTVLGSAKLGDARLVNIGNAVAYYARGSSCSLAVIEGLPFGSNDRSVALVHGTARTELARLGIPYVYIYPHTLKQFATGSGDADKPEMIAAVEAAIGWTPPDSDQADAWWLRRMGLAALRLVPASDEQLAILGRTKWPAPVNPWGEPVRVRKDIQCRHKIYVVPSGDHWLHPFNVVVCDKPPKTTRIR